MKKYKEYKASEIEWLGDIPADWDIKKIKWMTSIKRGASPRPIDDPKYFDEDGEYAWVRIADVSSAGMYLEQTTQKMSDLGASLSVKREPGDIFVSIAGTVGKPCITNIKCCIHDGFVYFPDYKGEKKYLYYIFESGAPYKGLGKMGTQLNLNTETIGSIKIPNISLSLQRKIVFFLDKKVKEIDTLLNLKLKEIEILEQQRQSIITEAITKGLNPNVKMKDSGVEWIGEIPEHWNLSKVKFEVFINKNTLNDNIAPFTEIEYIDIGSVNSKGEILNKEKYRFEDAPSRARRVVNNGDTLISTVRTYLKAITTVEFQQENLIASTGFAVLTPKEKIRSKYLGYIFKSSVYVDEIVSRSTGVSYPAINASEIGNLELIFPPIEEQNRIIQFLDRDLNKMDNTISLINDQINKLKEYRQALIYEAVTGKIDVSDMEPDLSEVSCDGSGYFRERL
ncbi:type I restriction enzyme S subunit [Neobacillus niacini]|uniref:restriction endonuclease subunit S n=1 Tax=Neobacillus niacini TaxID=86668 RepID=UPI00277DC426|nr:restriction endonuclease subunit S [Neobacillus niacini]MDQ1002695.1 type I restriction enzyme S subunit [Neobacillus niacini]